MEIPRKMVISFHAIEIAINHNQLNFKWFMTESIKSRSLKCEFPKKRYNSYKICDQNIKRIAEFGNAQFSFLS
jgi:hypothetical protein